jgi:hypothetical protein
VYATVTAEVADVSAPNAGDAVIVAVPGAPPINNGFCVDVVLPARKTTWLGESVATAVLLLDRLTNTVEVGACASVTLNGVVFPGDTDTVAGTMMLPGVTTVSVNGFIAVSAVGVVESLTISVTLFGPAVVGVPVIAPVALEIDSPAGRPVAEKVYGVTPPVAVTGVLYAKPTTALGSDVVVMLNPGLIVIDRFAVAVFCGTAESFTVTVTLLVPVAPGIPVIAPVVLEMVNAEGRPVALKV